MNKIDEYELLRINGGGINVWFITGIYTIVTFLAGVIDGYTRPFKCNR